MTKSELIELLAPYPDNAEVYIYELEWIYEDCSKLRELEVDDIKVSDTTRIVIGEW